MRFFRYFHFSYFNENINKSNLAILRKNTGYTFENCRKALKIANNDLVKAEEWLREQAKALGWQAAIKVQNRKTNQGLIGVILKNKKVAMVEVNCETDFVARNHKFRSFVELATSTCLKSCMKISEEDTMKVSLSPQQLQQMKDGDKPLSDYLVDLIGSLGENVAFKKAFCYETTKENVKIAVGVHPPDDRKEILLGKYASFLVFQQNSKDSETLECIGSELCQHIIGMNPKTIGEYNCENSSENLDEKDLVHQKFLKDDSITVGDLLKSNGITILDFKRFECGETENEETESNIAYS